MKFNKIISIAAISSIGTSYYIKRHYGYDEFMHNIYIKMLKQYTIQNIYLKYINKPFINNRLSTTIFEYKFDNIIGISAGIDKNGEIFSFLKKLGYGHVEIGTFTYNKQNGNVRPRLWINRNTLYIKNKFGFNNIGLRNLQCLDNLNNVILSIGLSAPVVQCGNITVMISELKNILEYIPCKINDLGFITINISSPNTIGMKKYTTDINFLSKLGDLLLTHKHKNIKIFYKLPPIELEELRKLIKYFNKNGYPFDALIIANTKNGESGINFNNIEMIREIRKLNKHIPLIASGGIFSGQDVYDYLEAGADLVQICSAFILHHNALEKISEELLEIMDLKGIKNISEIKVL
jgi:dihydroorotate dehydrogenase